MKSAASSRDPVPQGRSDRPDDNRGLSSTPAHRSHGHMLSKDKRCRQLKRRIQISALVGLPHGLMFFRMVPQNWHGRGSASSIDSKYGPFAVRSAMQGVSVDVPSESDIFFNLMMPDVFRIPLSHDHLLIAWLPSPPVTATLIHPLRCLTDPVRRRSLRHLFPRPIRLYARPVSSNFSFCSSSNSHSTTSPRPYMICPHHLENQCPQLRHSKRNL